MRIRIQSACTVSSLVGILTEMFAGLNRQQPSLSELQPEAVEARLRAGKKTPHLEAYIAWFNRLSQLVASSICLLKKKKKRVHVIGRKNSSRIYYQNFNLPTVIMGEGR